ncbi:putative invertase inhibitor [Papaver somniferum]|uniref:putative invertase inhibitor n=1 Tax=Papaver somniferum TaxID=3469 RepID=UPI000E6FBD58|nr:putative invertase inhibitor [Papaver somniferum]
MSHLFPFPFSTIFIVFLVLNSFHDGVNGDLVSDVCKKASKTDPKKHHFCVTSLSANPASKHARDLSDLGLISMRTCLRKATSIHSYIAKNLKQGKENPTEKQWFQRCLELYSSAIDGVQKAIESFKIKDYSSANIEITTAKDSSVTCEDLFKENFGPDLTSPLAKQDGEFSQLTEISLDITCAFMGTCS